MRVVTKPQDLSTDCKQGTHQDLGRPRLMRKKTARSLSASPDPIHTTTTITSSRTRAPFYMNQNSYWEEVGVRLQFRSPHCDHRQGTVCPPWYFVYPSVPSLFLRHRLYPCLCPYFPSLDKLFSFFFRHWQRAHPRAWESVPGKGSMCPDFRLLCHSLSFSLFNPCPSFLSCSIFLQRLYHSFLFLSSPIHRLSLVALVSLFFFFSVALSPHWGGLAGYRHWHVDVRMDDTPLEAGMTWVCKLKTNTPFLGREALEAQRAAGLKKRLCYVKPNEDVPIFGLEALLRNGEPVGYLRRAGYAFSLKTPLGIAYVHAPEELATVTPEWIKREDVKWELEVMGRRVPVTVSLGTPFDPKNLRVKGQYD